MHRPLVAATFTALFTLAVTAETGRLTPSPDVITGRGGRASFLIPIVGNAAGANNTYYRSDITIVNHDNVAQDVLIDWFEQGVDNTGRPPLRITIPANQFQVYEDFVANVIGRTGVLGAVRFRAVLTGTDTARPEAHIDAFSRIWTPQAGGTGTVSQSLPATDADLGATANPAFILGLRQDGQFRTNIGVVNLAPFARTFLVDVAGAGPAANFAVDVPAFSLRQVNFPAGSFGHVIVTVSPQEAGSWFAYGSSVDNATGDGWTSRAEYRAVQ